MNKKLLKKECSIFLCYRNYEVLLPKLFKKYCDNLINSDAFHNKKRHLIGKI